MAKQDIKQYSLNDLKKMRERGDYIPTRPDAPTLNPDEDFWRNAEVRMPQHKTSIHMRVDDDILDWFKAQGRGHLSRMHAVLRSYVETQRKPQR
jgi:uncharacterized protein (DUF4415 family)